jgi:glycosyltransferase involved in cell wall biosynthesis
VQIWQEETVFDTALAALLAGVPRIVLCLRSVPPIDRPERYRAEYPVLFHSLLAARNVVFSCNSEFAAGRYSEWLGIDRERIQIVRNGVERLPADGDAASVALHNDFDARTRGAGCFTIGVIMRMDENKRPFLWVETAAQILQQAPEARFILVGNGPLRKTVIQWLKEQGILHRFLFVGVSFDVGYWLSKMDLFMLLSKEEGLPNSVIEAQLGRLPVVVTPAGGAPEAIIPGVTGFVTNPNPTAAEVTAVAMALVKQPRRAQMMGNAGEAWARKSFSMARMLHEQTTLLTGTGR